MKKLIPKGLVCAIIIIATGCNASKNTLDNPESWIPADFNPAKTILLVQKFPYPERTGQEMEEYMKEKYPYKYEFVSAAIIESKTGKYADTKKYKYALVLSMHNSTPKSKAATTNFRFPSVGFDFNFIDRSSAKKYPATNKSSTFAITTFKPVINTIVYKY